MSNNLESGLATVQKIAQLWKSGQPTSLIEFTKAARVEPIVLIDSDVMLTTELPDVMQSLLSQYAGYYTMAMSLMTNVGGVQVGRQLDKLNPNRNGPSITTGFADGAFMISAESYKNKLPSFKKVPALEEVEIAAVGKNTTTQLRELENLSVGKNLTITIKDGDNTADVMVAVRLIASTMATSKLVHILSQGNEDTSFKERYHAWRSGRIELIRDLVMCQDLIAQKRRNLMNDKDGVLTEIQKRRRNNGLSSILSGNVSIATASNMVVISDTTAAMLENEVNGKLDNFKTREAIFGESSIMIMAVIDKQWNRIKFYHRSIPTATELAPRDLKASNKGSGPDVMELMKAYQMGNNPSL